MVFTIDILTLRLKGIYHWYINSILCTLCLTIVLSLDHHLATGLHRMSLCTDSSAGLHSYCLWEQMSAGLGEQGMVFMQV